MSRRTRHLLSCLLSAAALPAQQAPDVAGPDWAFAPLLAVEPPAVADDAWNQHPIDRFVRRGLDRAGLVPNPPAERRTLLRRATFVLTGLPPTPTEIDAFLADDAADSFERVVDRLLASPHYGEQQARHWLDLARYSDSNGLDENLAFANAFRYRDWVTAAHNTDLPFDRFVAMQLAGDLMVDDPAVGLDGYVATGFLALGPRMLAEQDKEKLVLDTIDEQIDLVGRTFLGLTIGCARCHDHKFDPLPTRDYYALAGIFRSTKSFDELGHVSQWFDRPLESDAAVGVRRAAEAAQQAAKEELEAASADAIAAAQRLLVEHAGRYLLAGRELLRTGQYLEAEAASDTSLHIDARTWGSADCVVLHTNQPGLQFAEWRLAPVRAGNYQLAVRFAAEQSRPMRVVVDGRVVVPATLAETTGGWLPAQQRWSFAAEFPLTAGEHVLRLEGNGAHVPHLDALLLTPIDNTTDSPLTAGLLPPVVQHVAAVLGNRRLQPLLACWHQLADVDEADFVGTASSMQGQGGFTAALLGGEVPTSLAALAERYATLFASAAAAVAEASAKARPEQPEPKMRLPDPQLEAARALMFDPDGLFALPSASLQAWLPAQATARLSQLRERLASCAALLPPPAPTVMCVAEDTVRDLPVHLRGSHLSLAATTTPRGFLSVFAAAVPAAPLPADHSGRRELAQWLVAPGQPLTPRVLANRLWQRAFGQGLVRSPSNFGRRGDRPVHQELLDWLAADLRRHGWSQKHLWKCVLLSRTWQQSSDVRPEAVLVDAENRLLWRQERVRLQAESLRDAMLMASGQLDETIGGNLLQTKDRGYVTNDQSNDQARYDSKRRSLYLPVIRNAMFDLFCAFDYVDPSVHLEQRPSSAIATQALYLLNAPFVREQSRALAALVASMSDDDGTLWLWRQTLQRAPTADERELVRTWLAHARNAGKPDEAWPGLAQALLASSEFLYVD